MRIVVFFLAIFQSLSIFAAHAEQSYYELADSADYYINNEKYAQAENMIMRALRLEPGNYNNSLLLSNLATIQRMQGRNSEAVKNYTFAINMTPNAVTLLKNRASLYLEMDSLDRSFSDYKKVAGLDASDMESRYYCALIALERGDVQKSQEYISELKNIDAKSDETIECLARMHQYMRHFQEAASLYSQLLRKDDSRNDLRVHRAECYLKCNNPALASVDIEESIARQPSDAYLYILKARLKKMQYQFSDAENCISLAVKYGIDKADADLLMRADW